MAHHLWRHCKDNILSAILRPPLSQIDFLVRTNCLAFCFIWAYEIGFLIGTTCFFTGRKRIMNTFLLYIYKQLTEVALPVQRNSMCFYYSLTFYMLPFVETTLERYWLRRLCHTNSNKNAQSCWFERQEKLYQFNSSFCTPVKVCLLPTVRYLKLQ